MLERIARSGIIKVSQVNISGEEIDRRVTNFGWHYEWEIFTNQLSADIVLHHEQCYSVIVLSQALQ